MYVLTITVTRKNKGRTDYIVKMTYILYYKIARLVNRGEKIRYFFWTQSVILLWAARSRILFNNRS